MPPDGLPSTSPIYVPLRMMPWRASKGRSPPRVANFGERFESTEPSGTPSPCAVFGLDEPTLGDSGFGQKHEREGREQACNGPAPSRKTEPGRDPPLPHVFQTRAGPYSKFKSLCYDIYCDLLVILRPASQRVSADAAPSAFRSPLRRSPAQASAMRRPSELTDRWAAARLR